MLLGIKLLDYYKGNKVFWKKIKICKLFNFLILIIFMNSFFNFELYFKFLEKTVLRNLNFDLSIKKEIHFFRFFFFLRFLSKLQNKFWNKYT